jgi:arylsulfatase A-like enzyme
MNKLGLVSNTLFLLYLLTFKQAEAMVDKPNIIFLLTDDQASWSVGYNNPEFLTPEIDKLAQQGVRFTRHYNTSAICMASRANIMTGKHEYKTGTNFMHGNMSREIFANSYPILLRKAGYYTGFVGKFGFETPPNKSQGLPKAYQNLPVDLFDVWYGGKKQTSFNTSKNHYIKKFADKYPHATSANGAAAIEFIEQAQQKKQPFMLSVSFKAPHAPVDPDPQFDKLFANRKYSRPENYWRSNGQHLALQAKLGRQYLTKDGFGFAPATYNRRMAQYNQQIYGVDVVIGQIRASLAQLDLTDNTVIIFSSDNGYFNGNHGFSRKVLPYEESVSSPMIVLDPRKPEAHYNKVNQLTANIDIAPTILALAGVPKPSALDGKDIMMLSKDNALVNHQYLPLINVWGSAPAQGLAVVTTKWKYIYWFYGDGVQPTEELFDLVNDAGEMLNLAKVVSHQPTLEQMRSYYDQQVVLWRDNAVSFNGYKPYAVLFDRNLSWHDKESLIEPQFIHAYKKLTAPYYKNKAKFIEFFGVQPLN